MEIQKKGQIETALSMQRQKETILTGIFGIYQKGIPMPQELKMLEAEVLQNVALPLFAENINQIQSMGGGEQEEVEEEGMMQEQQEVPEQQEQLIEQQ